MKASWPVRTLADRLKSQQRISRNANTAKKPAPSLRQPFIDSRRVLDNKIMLAEVLLFW